MTEDEKNLTKEEANKLISDKLETAQKLVTECEELATHHELEFSLDIAYGMGGWFSSGEWDASSQSC